MISLTEFVPDRAAEESVILALDAMREVYVHQNRLDTLPQPLAGILANPDPGDVYTHRDVICRNRTIMNYAAETGCVALWRLRIEDVGDRTDMELLVPRMGRNSAVPVIHYLGGHNVDFNVTNPRDTHGHTALHCAVYGGQLDAVQALIAQPGIDLECVDQHGTTPLDLAIIRGLRAAVVDLLATAAAQIRPDAVVQLCRSHELDTLEVVLRHGADPNAFSPKIGIAPLHAAITNVYPQVARRLLESGADPLLPTRRMFKARNVKYPRGATPSDYLGLAQHSAPHPDSFTELRDLLTQAINDHHGD
jgi:hypothetical protein